MRSIFEIVGVEGGPPSEDAIWSIDFPSALVPQKLKPSIYGELQVFGWAMSTDAPVVAIEAGVPGHEPARAAPGLARPDVAAHFPDIPHAGQSGFLLSVDIPAAPRAEVAVRVVLPNGERVNAGIVCLATEQREGWSAADAPLVSVVIPCYNQAHFLREAVESARRQTYPNVEIIVIDDGSTDNTAAVAAALGVHCVQQENRGLPGARNRGLEESTGDYVVFLDADDRLLPHGLEANADAFSARPGADLVCGWGGTITHAGTMIWPYFGPPPISPDKDPYTALLAGDFSIACPAQVMYRRASVVSAGGFNPSLAAAEDFELYLRMAREGTMYIHSNGPISEYRQHPGAMSRDPTFMLRSMLVVLRGQKRWVWHDRPLRAAYKRGVANVCGYYGEQLARDLAIAIRDHKVFRTIRAIWSMLRYYREGFRLASWYIRDPTRLAFRMPPARKGLPARTRMPAKRTSTPTWLLPGPIRRLREHLRETRRLVDATLEQVIDARGEQNAADARMDARLQELEQRLSATQREQHRQVVEILRLIHGRNHDQRRRLRELRADPSYELPYTEPDPLISVVMRTYQDYHLMRDRSIPSVLVQTYHNFEIVIVGDAAPEDARIVAESFDDPRIRFSNLPYRGPYPEDPAARWRASGTPAYNEAVQLARGLWIAPLDADDAFRPQHLERLLELAREQRLELAYSRQRVHAGKDGCVQSVPGIPDVDVVGRFPPEHGEFGVQSTLYHHGLGRIFEFELADAVLGLPNDWGLCVRMMEAGVRMGMLDEETVDYYPSRARAGEDGERLYPRLSGAPDEMAFWANYLATKGSDWPGDYAHRFDPNADVADSVLCDRLENIPGSTVELLDVGAGPVTQIGYTLRGRKLRITAVDPLADAYNRLLDAHGLMPPVRTISGSGERLVEQFGKDRFDVAYARNSVDHSPDPIRVIEQMLCVVTRGGMVILRHYRNEGENAAYEGLHQWNFDVNPSGRLLLWNRTSAHDLTEEFADRADVQAWQEEPNWVIAVLVPR
jgi:glycosyltransferase involved in cell wall biosynthesis